MTIKSLPKLPSMPKSRASVKCACGCPGLTQSRFVPGHDSKLKGMRLRVEQGVWDRSDPLNLDAQLDALAEFLGPNYAIATAEEMKLDWSIEEWSERAEAKAVNS